MDRDTYECLPVCRCAYAAADQPGGEPVLVPSDDCDLHWPLAVDADQDCGDAFEPQEFARNERAELGDG